MMMMRVTLVMETPQSSQAMTDQIRMIASSKSHAAKVETGSKALVGVKASVSENLEDLMHVKLAVLRKAAAVKATAR